MDILLIKYDVILTEFENIDLDSASVSTVKFSKYHTILTESKVHNCIRFTSLGVFIYQTIVANIMTVIINNCLYIEDLDFTQQAERNRVTECFITN